MCTLTVDNIGFVYTKLVWWFFFVPDEKSLATMLGFIDTIEGMLSDGHKKNWIFK
jgi:hypothetical protein